MYIQYVQNDVDMRAKQQQPQQRQRSRAKKKSAHNSGKANSKLTNKYKIAFVQYAARIFFPIPVLARGIRQHFCTDSKINTRNLCTAALVRPDNVYAICVLFAKKIKTNNNGTSTSNQATLISNGISIEIIGLDVKRNAHINLIPMDRAAWPLDRSILCRLFQFAIYLFYTPKNGSNNMLSISHSMHFNFTLIFIVHNRTPILQSLSHTRTRTLTPSSTQSQREIHYIDN